MPFVALEVIFDVVTSIMSEIANFHLVGKLDAEDIDSAFCEFITEDLVRYTFGDDDENRPSTTFDLISEVMTDYLEEVRLNTDDYKRLHNVSLWVCVDALGGHDANHYIYRGSHE